MSKSQDSDLEQDIPDLVWLVRNWLEGDGLWQPKKKQGPLLGHAGRLSGRGGAGTGSGTMNRYI